MSEPKKVLFINEKGGCGKTTLVDEMCFCCEMENIPYNLHNLDPQGSLLHEPVKNDGAWFDFIDTPGHLREKTKEYIKAADVIVVPTEMTQNAMSSLTMVLGIAHPDMVVDEKPVVVVLNKWDGGVACEAFQEWFDEIRRQLTKDGRYNHLLNQIQISRSVNFANARMYKQSVIQYRRSCKSAYEIQRLFFEIICVSGYEKRLTEEGTGYVFMM